MLSSRSNRVCGQAKEVKHTQTSEVTTRHNACKLGCGDAPTHDTRNTYMHKTFMHIHNTHMHAHTPVPPVISAAVRAWG